MKEKLIEKAKEAQKKAYAPYSNFKVGAAVLTKEDNIYSGCNIENASYSLTCCAERIAIFNAVKEAESSFKHLVVIGESDEAISPCGACRQVMSEFFSEETKITLLNNKGLVKETTIKELLPYSFKLS